MKAIKERVKIRGRKVRLALEQYKINQLQPSVRNALASLQFRQRVANTAIRVTVEQDEAQKAAIERMKNAHVGLFGDQMRYHMRQNQIARNLLGDLFRIESLDEERIMHEVDRVLRPNDVSHEHLLNTRVYFPCETMPNEEMERIDHRMLRILFDPRADHELTDKQLAARVKARNTLAMDQTCIGLVVPKDANPEEPGFWDYRYVYRNISGIYKPLTKEMMWWFVMYPMERVLRQQQKLKGMHPSIKISLYSRLHGRKLVPLLPPTKALLNSTFETFAIADRREALNDPRWSRTAVLEREAQDPMSVFLPDMLDRYSSDEEKSDDEFSSGAIVVHCVFWLSLCIGHAAEKASRQASVCAILY